ncbi:MAG: hypothetical protein IKN74_05125 [Clostridia bacterium]|nr:hypothetical protein [Clostridia bacterium]
MKKKKHIILLIIILLITVFIITYSYRRLINKYQTESYIIAKVYEVNESANYVYVKSLIEDGTIMDNSNLKYDLSLSLKLHTDFTFKKNNIICLSNTYEKLESYPAKFSPSIEKNIKINKVNNIEYQIIKHYFNYKSN